MGVKIKFNLALLCMFGSIIVQNVNAEFGIADSLMGGAFSEIILSIDESTRHLKTSEIDTHKEHLPSVRPQISERCRDENLHQQLVVLKSWSYDKCVEMKDDIVKASEIFFQGTDTFWNITQQAGAIGNEILNCKLEWNALNTVKCYNNNFLALKTLVHDGKNMIMPIVEAWKATLKEIRMNFYACFGVPEKSKLLIERQLGNC